jgi:hypothetical protein
VDGSQGLDQVWLGGVHGARTVTAQTGLTLERLWGLLGEAGLAVAAPPAPGHLTLGGALAIGAHGSALALDGPVPGWTFGSLSNAVLALDAVVWDEGTRRYRVRTFHRGEPAIEPLLAHAGRAFLTAATLQVGTDVNLRCRSFTEIPAAEVFAAPGSAGPRCLQAWAGEAGRVEATWFPFQDCPWLRVWSTAPAQPDDSLVLEEPYPFTFANWVSREDSDWTAAQLRANPWRTPPFLALAMDAVRAGLLLTGTGDVWGPSRFSSLHVEPSTLRYHVSGHAILCRSGDIQRVASECFGFVAGLLERERCRGVYPVNGPVDLRISGLDQLAEVGVPGAREALLSPLRPRPDHPEWDCVVWLEVLTLPGTPGSARFYTELEAWLLGHYVGDYAAVRMEWAKGWGYSPQGAWTAETVLGGHIPDSYSSGQAETGSWLRALEGLHALDPQAVYGNVFLDGLFKARR